MPCRAAAVHLVLLLAGGTTLAGGATCKFEAEVDYGNGKQTQPAGWPKDDLSKVDCCEACADAPAQCAFWSVDYNKQVCVGVGRIALSFQK